MEYLECKFSIALDEADTEVRLVTQTIPKEKSICDKKLSHKLKGKFYNMVIRPSLLYEKKHIMELRILRWMCGYTRSDKIRSKVIIWEKVIVADKMRETRMK
ncbi:hypothetical protein H5410_042398 [Solanum commersonii]|uniref:Uncharacterized protein n=1 Tax=Solanum commersonii TaxID=4109 RepID=A0A9J5XXH8_SOLCO|nr:hypothetical protein H5410_042398 [Solanum commersonii]